MTKCPRQGGKFEFTLAWPALAWLALACLQIQISRPDLGIWSYVTFSGEGFLAIKIRLPLAFLPHLYIPWRGKNRFLWVLNALIPDSEGACWRASRASATEVVKENY